MELLRALAVLAEPPGTETTRLASLLGLPHAPTAEEYTEVFLFQLYPYASVYTSDEGHLGGEARDRVAGFWRAIGLVPPAEPDHLAALVGLYAALADRERDAPDDGSRERWRHRRRTLLWEHLLCWLGPYLARVRELGGATYGAWAALLAETLAAEARAVGQPAVLPAHLREAAPLPAPEDGADAWLTALLAPARSGFILTRADLARGAATLGLGLRAGERRFALRALLEQDAGATVEWLAHEARRAALGTAPGSAAVIDDWWARRARATADALGRLGAKETIHA